MAQCECGRALADDEYVVEYSGEHYHVPSVRPTGDEELIFIWSKKWGPEPDVRIGSIVKKSDHGKRTLYTVTRMAPWATAGDPDELQHVWSVPKPS